MLLVHPQQARATPEAKQHSSAGCTSGVPEIDTSEPPTTTSPVLSTPPLPATTAGEVSSPGSNEAGKLLLEMLQPGNETEHNAAMRALALQRMMGTLTPLNGSF